MRKLLLLVAIMFGLAACASPGMSNTSGMSNDPIDSGVYLGTSN